MPSDIFCLNTQFIHMKAFRGPYFFLFRLPPPDKSFETFWQVLLGPFSNWESYMHRLADGISRHVLVFYRTCKEWEAKTSWLAKRISWQKRKFRQEFQVPISCQFFFFPSESKRRKGGENAFRKVRPGMQEQEPLSVVQNLVTSFLQSPFMANYTHSQPRSSVLYTSKHATMRQKRH